MNRSMTAIALAMSLAFVPAGFLVAQEAAPVPAPVEAPAQLELVEGQARDALLEEIATALGKVETTKGRFRQYNPDFTENTGDFFIRRPGRLRFDYDDPSPLLILSDGTTVAVEDSDLETQDRFPLRATPLAAILDDEINLAEKVNVLSVERTDDYVAVVSEDKTGELEGQLVMVFDSTDYALLQWHTINVNGDRTSVELSAVETGISINPRLFRIEELDEEDERD